LRLRALFAVAVLGLFGLACGRAEAAPGLMVGATEDMFKLQPDLAGAYAQDLGLRGTRISLRWQPGQTAVAPADVAQIRGALTSGVRIILSVYGTGDAAPQDDASREAYCSFVRDALVQVPAINDVVIWNEPNLSYFWKPQFGVGGMPVAPAAYEALLARCWDVLHAFRPGVNVVAFATAPSGNDDPAMPSPSHSPVEFIRDVGDAYRASGRKAPLFDTVSHHVYGASPGERPWQRLSTSKRISEGDLGKLVETLQAGFSGTSQPAPGMPVSGRSMSIWYLESGFQTTPSAAKAALYSSTETATALPDWTGGLPWSVLPDADSLAPDQATQLRDAVRLAYCQPYVTAIFNFLLRDQPELNRWQSGVLWTDGTPKASYVAWRGAIAEANSGTVNCSLFADPSAQPPTGAGDEPASGATNRPPQTKTPPPPFEPATIAPHVLTIAWAGKVGRVYGRQNRRWRVTVKASQRARYVATIETLAGRRRLAVRGTLVPRRTTMIAFPRRRLAPGRYRIVVRSGSIGLRSAPFRVR
jgi:hypothetical protein